MFGNTPKRLLLTGDTAGGVWTFVTDLSASLIQRGLDVQLATFGPTVTPAQTARAESIAGLKWTHRLSKLEWMNNPWSDVEAGGRWLETLARKFEPELVHLNTLSYGDRTFDVPVVQTVHSCVLSWWTAVKHSRAPSQWNRYRDHVQASLQRVERLTAPSAAALAEIARYYRLNKASGVSIHNGIDATGFQPLAPEPFIFSASRLWDEAKNLIALAEVAPQLAWPVYLAGSSISPTGGVTDFQCCHSLGELSREELRLWYGRASIYVLPAKYEPFGLSILEAALCGCSLVLGDIPSLREIWGEAAIFVPPDDRESLRHAINRLIVDTRYRLTMARRALTRARQFSLDRMTGSFLDVYRSALKLRSGSHACAS